MRSNIQLIFAQTRSYRDEKHPGITWTVFDGPFKDEEGERYFEFTGSDGSDAQGYIIEYGIVDIVNIDYYGD